MVTTTRNPSDFYVAEHERTRWVHELRDPTRGCTRRPGLGTASG
ncbi:hypothetical protein [Nocardioides scoriae]|nr:hypothetical protein [Nocardioides scoriae]